jgi:hypothetical protein
MPGPELPTARGLACPVGPGPQLYTGSSQQPPRGELGHSHPGSEATSGFSHAGTGSSRASLRRMMWLWVCPILWLWAPYFLAVVFFQVAILLIRMTVVSSGCVDRASLSGGAASPIWPLVVAFISCSRMSDCNLPVNPRPGHFSHGSVTCQCQ